MLVCKNLCRGHNAALITIVGREKGSQDSHHRLSAPHISLKQSVHLFSAHHIGSNLFYNPFLSIREFKRNICKTSVEIVTYLGHKHPYRFSHSYFFLLQK